MSDTDLNISSLALSTIALIALFETCIKGCDFVATARATTTRSQQILSQIDIEKRRLAIWGRRWGAQSDDQTLIRLEHDLNVADTRQIIHNALTSIHQIVCDVEKLQQKYGLDIADLRPKNAGDTLPNAFDSVPDTHPTVLAAAANWNEGNLRRQEELSLLSKMTYSFKDESRLLNLCQDLSWFVNRLWDQLMSDKMVDIERCLLSEVLSRVKSEHELRLLLGTSNPTTNTIQRHAEAQILGHNMERAAVENSSARFTFEKKVNKSLLRIQTNAQSTHTRSIADFFEQHTVAGRINQRRPIPVLLEWKRGRWDAEFDIEMEKRIDNLAIMLNRVRSIANDESFRILECMGYFEESVPNTFGLFYRLPRDAAPMAQPVSLYNLLTTDKVHLDRMPSLDCRVRLAQMLTTSLHELHSSGWVHKQISSANIVFFKREGENKFVEKQLLDLYLVGFGISRPANDPRGTEDKTPLVNPSQSTVDFYRHPSQLVSRSRREHDMYSLGPTLLEIARWNSIEALVEEKNGSPDKFHEEVISYAEEIDFDVGKTYCEVVKTLLKSVDGSTWTTPTSLFAARTLDLAPQENTEDEFNVQQQGTLRDFYYSAVAKLESIAL